MQIDQIKSFIHSVISKYQPDNENDDFYEFTIYLDGGPDPVLYTEQGRMGFFAWATNDNVFVCGPRKFDDDGLFMTVPMAFKKDDQLVKVQFMAVFNEKDYALIKKFNTYYNQCLIDDLLKEIKP